MSTDIYAKFILEQQRSMVNAGLAEDIRNSEIETNEFDDIAEAIIDALAEDIQDLQELSPELKARYVKKAGNQLFKAAYRAARDAPTGEAGRTSRNAPVSTQDHRIKGHKDAKTIDKRISGINKAAKHGVHKMTGDNVSYSGFEAGHDIHTQRRSKVGKHIRNARSEIKTAVSQTKPKD